MNDIIKYSIIVPVYNRPEEIKELLETITEQTYKKDFEVLIIEDGSTISSKEIVDNFKDTINIKYYYKNNSGPGDSRNYGMRVAEGNYFIILDSDCLLPKDYLKNVDDFLQKNYVDCFGGADAATNSFTDIQKAINYAMTSFLPQEESEEVGKVLFGLNLAVLIWEFRKKLSKKQEVMVKFTQEKTQI